MKEFYENKKKNKVEGERNVSAALTPKEAANQWNTLTEEEKKRYKDKEAEMRAKY